MTVWRKSSYSEGGGATDCVELADLNHLVGIRDSKDSSGGHLSVSRAALSGLVHRIKHDEYGTGDVGGHSPNHP